MSLGLRKLPIVFSFRYISQLQVDISNSVYRRFVRIRRSSSNLVPVEYFLAELCPLDLKKFKLLLVSAHFLYYKLTF